MTALNPGTYTGTVNGINPDGKKVIRVKLNQGGTLSYPTRNWVRIAGRIPAFGEEVEVSVGRKRITRVSYI